MKYVYAVVYTDKHYNEITQELFWKKSHAEEYRKTMDEDFYDNSVVVKIPVRGSYDDQ